MSEDFVKKPDPATSYQRSTVKIKKKPYGHYDVVQYQRLTKISSLQTMVVCQPSGTIGLHEQLIVLNLKRKTVRFLPMFARSAFRRRLIAVFFQQL